MRNGVLQNQLRRRAFLIKALMTHTHWKVSQEQAVTHPFDTISVKDVGQDMLTSY